MDRVIIYYCAIIHVHESRVYYTFTLLLKLSKSFSLLRASASCLSFQHFGFSVFSCVCRSSKACGYLNFFVPASTSSGTVPYYGGPRCHCHRCCRRRSLQMHPSAPATVTAPVSASRGCVHSGSRSARPGARQIPQHGCCPVHLMVALTCHGGAAVGATRSRGVPAPPRP